MQTNEIKEITLDNLFPEEFIFQKLDEISEKVDDGVAVNTLSGGVDSSVVTILGHMALNDRLLTYFIDNGLMREGEPERVVSLFKERGIEVDITDARKQFFDALKGLTDPEEKREAITQTFYRGVFAGLVKETGAKHILQGTILTDIEETVAGIKRQHNVLEQLGINTEEQFGYKVIEPLIQLRKPAVREVAKALGLPKETYNRMPFPGPALAARVKGEVTPEKILVVRRATSIVEEELKNTKAFQYMAILQDERTTGIRDGKRDYGLKIELRCWDSKDAVTAEPTKLPYDTLFAIRDKITTGIPGVVSVTYNITAKPPSTMEEV